MGHHKNRGFVFGCAVNNTDATPGANNVDTGSYVGIRFYTGGITSDVKLDDWYGGDIND